jgi:fructuronate reductase
MRYVAGRDERGGEIDVRDPLAAKLREVADSAGPEPERLARALLGVGAVFGRDLPADSRFVAAVTRALGRLHAVGARAAVAEVG